MAGLIGDHVDIALLLIAVVANAFKIVAQSHIVDAHLTNCLRQLCQRHHTAAFQSGRRIGTADLCRQAFHKENRETALVGLADKGCKVLGDIAGIGHHQCTEVIAVDGQGLAVKFGAKAFGLCEQIRPDDLKVDLIFHQCPGRLLGQHVTFLTTGPFCLCMIQKTHRRNGFAAVEQMGNPVHIPHQIAEALIQGVVAVGIEVGRAVSIGEFSGREGMGHKVVDTANQQMVRQIFLQPGTGAPAVGAEKLTHGGAVLPGIQMSVGRAQLAQQEVEKFAVQLRRCRAADKGTAAQVMLTAQQNLTADAVNTGHVLTGQTTELMAEALTHTGVLVVVFNGMTDVTDTVVGAPVTDLQGEVPLHQPGDDIHIDIAHLGGNAVGQRGIPDGGHLGDIILAHALLQGSLHLIRPTDGHGVTDPVFIAAVDVAQRGFIAEETGNGLAEIVLIMLPMGFIDSLDLLIAGFLADHVDVVLGTHAVPGQIQHENAPVAAGNIPVEHIVLVHQMGQVYQRGGINALAVCLGSHHRQHLVIFEFPGRAASGVSGPHSEEGLDPVGHKLHIQLHTGRGAGHVTDIVEQILLAQLIGSGLHGTVGLSRGEVGIVQDPNLHAPGSGLIQNDVHVVPPLLSAEIGMGTALHTNRANTGTLNGTHVFPQNFLSFAMLPEEGEDIVLTLILQHIIESFDHVLHLVFKL